MNSSLLRCCKERARYIHVSRKLATVKEVIDTRTKGATFHAPRDENGKKVKADGRVWRQVPPYIGMTGRHHPHQGAREIARRLRHA